MNYGIKDAANLTLRKKKDKSIALYTEYANVTTNEWTSEQVYANAKGTRAIRWDHDKQGTLQVAMEVFDLKWLAILAGSDWETGSTNIFARETFTIESGNSFTLAATPVANSLSIFKLENDNVTNGDEQILGDSDEVDEYEINGRVVTLNATSAPVGSHFVAFYQKESEITASKLEFKANKHPESFEVVGDTFIRPKEGGEDEFVQIFYPNAKPIGNFTVTLDASAATNLEVTFDLFPDADGNLAVYTKL